MDPAQVTVPVVGQAGFEAHLAHIVRDTVVKQGVADNPVTFRRAALQAGIGLDQAAYHVPAFSSHRVSGLVLDLGETLGDERPHGVQAQLAKVGIVRVGAFRRGIGRDADAHDVAGSDAAKEAGQGIQHLVVVHVAAFVGGVVQAEVDAGHVFPGTVPGLGPCRTQHQQKGQGKLADKAGGGALCPGGSHSFCPFYARFFHIVFARMMKSATKIDAYFLSSKD